ncbi:hypothetical protein CsSME_00024502 [Camellia sinensis var. sinensis]
MKTILSSETMDIPDGVKIKVKAKMIEVEGPRGKLTRNFKHLNLDFQLITDEETGKKKLKIDAWFGSRKTTAAITTAATPSRIKLPSGAKKIVPSGCLEWWDGAQF